MCLLARTTALLLCFCSYISFSQSPSDTLDSARTVRNNGALEKSISILERYTASYPQDFNGYWLLGETLYWAKKFENSRTAYRQAIKLAPDNLYLKLDFSRVLLNTRKYRESKTLLQHLTQYAETKDAALAELARLYYWTGRIRKAQQTLDAVTMPHADLANLRDEVSVAGALTLNALGSYSSDSQPLEVRSAEVGASWALSALAAPSVDAASATFLTEKNVLTHAVSFGLSNKFTLAATGSALTVHGGYFVFSEVSKNLATYRLALDQRISGGVRIRLGIDRRPYLSTLASLDKSLVADGVQTYLAFGTEKTIINGRIGYDGTAFEDDNSISAFYAYMLTRQMGSDKLNISFGYSYAFNHAQADRFVPEAPLNWNNDGTLAGVYDPYFTPSQQNIHSGLINLQLRFSKHFTVGASATLALFATTSNPYFYAEQRGNALRLIKDFATIRYRPYELNAFSNIHLGDGAVIRMDYTFASTFFYERNVIKLVVKGFIK